MSTSKKKSNGDETTTEYIVSEEHKAAMAQGRRESQAINAYLAALRQNKPKRGRPRTVQSMEQSVRKIDEQLSRDDLAPLTEVKLIQERRDLLEAILAAQTEVDIADLEADFIEACSSFSDRKGISYATWRDVGVPVEVLRKAKISRSS